MFQQWRCVTPLKSYLNSVRYDLVTNPSTFPLAISKNSEQCIINDSHTMMKYVTIFVEVVFWLKSRGGATLSG